jgi:putative heme-binding domain-containing protein
MSQVGPGRMPRIGSTVVDERGLALVRDWIERLPPASPGDAARAAESRAAAAAIVNRLATEKVARERAALIDGLLGTTTAAMQLAQAVAGASLPPQVRAEVVARATGASTAEVRDLFERFLPEEERTKRLGAVVDPADILALAGDAERGRQIFFESEGARCRTCHKIRGQGTELGPDLSEIGRENSPAQLLESMLDPSRKIDPRYLVYVVETSSGMIHRGLLGEKNADAVMLKDEKNEPVRVAADEVSQLVAQPKSLMPDLLLRDMTAQDVADLTAFLGSLK